MPSSHARPLSAAPRRAPELSRRRLLSRAPAAVVVGGLVAGYGLWLGMGLRFARGGEQPRRRLFVARMDALAPGQSLVYELPDGEPVAIARLGDADGLGDFVAVSRICPHLGCRVRWRQNAACFECPCHDGRFDAAGWPLDGPPRDEGLPLMRYPLSARDGLLFVHARPFRPSSAPLRGEGDS